jgi:hypothetical protein
MKLVQLVSVAVIMMLVASCSNSIDFPVSAVAPAADIIASVKQDKNSNFEVTVTARNLAEAGRIAPGKTTYVVWVVTTDGEVKNLGQLDVKNARTASLNSLTAFEFSEIFITAEEAGDVFFPAGIEISRGKVKKK